MLTDMTEKNIFGDALNVAVGLAIAFTFRHLIIAGFLFAPLLLLMFSSPALAIVSLLTIILPILDSIQNNDGVEGAGSIITGGVFIAFVWFGYLMLAIMFI